MALRSLYVEGFGHYQHFTLGPLGPGLTVVAGPNEAGKSTLAACLQYILFGPVPRQPPPEALAGGRLGGRLEMESPRGHLTVERLQGAPPTLRGSEGGVATGEEALRQALGGLDRALYRSVYAFAAADLTGFERLGEPELRDRLFTGSLAGAGRSVSTALASLDRRQVSLWRPRADSRIGALNARLAQLGEQIDGAQRSAADLRRLLAELEAAGAQHRAEHRRAAAAEHRAQVLAAWAAALPHHRALHRLRAARADLATPQPVAAADTEAAATLTLAVARAAVSAAAARQLAEVRDAEWRARPAPSSLAPHAATLAELAAAGAAFQPAVLAARDLRAQQTEQRLARALAGAGFASAAAARAADLSAPTEAHLRHLAQSVRRQHEAEGAQAQAAEAHQRAAEALARAEAALAAAPRDPLAQGHAAAVEGLRRDEAACADATARLEALAVRRAAAEAEEAALAEEQTAWSNAAKDLAGELLSQHGVSWEAARSGPGGPEDAALAAAQTRLDARADLLDEAEAAVHAREAEAARAPETAARPDRRPWGVAAGALLVALGLYLAFSEQSRALAPGVAVAALGVAVASASLRWLGPSAATAAPAQTGPSAGTAAAALLSRLGLPAQATAADLVRVRAEVRRAGQAVARAQALGQRGTALAARARILGESKATLAAEAEALGARVTAWRQRLAAVVAAGLARPGPDALAQAEARCREAARDAEALQGLAARRTHLAEACAEAAARLATARAHCAAEAEAEARFAQARAAARLPEAVTPAGFDSFCEQARTVGAELAASDALAVERAAAEAEAARWRAAVQRVAEAAGLPAPSTTAAASLWLAAAERTVAEDALHHAAQAQAQAEAEAAARAAAAEDARWKAAQDELATLLARHGLATVEALAERAAAWHAAVAADRQIEAAERARDAALGAAAGDPQTLAALNAALVAETDTALAAETDTAPAPEHTYGRSEVFSDKPEPSGEILAGPTETTPDAHGPAVWAQRRAEAEAEAADARARADAALEARVHLDATVAALHGSDALAAWATERAGLVAELAEAQRALAVLVLAQTLLSRTLERFRAAHQPRVLRVAGADFAAVTAGAYTAIEPDLEGKGLVVLDRVGGRRRAESLSTGATELLYLVLRLSLARDLSTEGVPLPLVLDDVLVNLDPERAGPVVDLLAAVAATRQVILFTCHPSTCARIQAQVPGAAVVNLERFGGRAQPAASAQTRGGTPSRAESTQAVDQRILAVLASRAEPWARQEILDAAEVPAAAWNATIARLKTAGVVAQVGERKGARYHLATTH